MALAQRILNASSQAWLLYQLSVRCLWAPDPLFFAQLCDTEAQPCKYISASWDTINIANREHWRDTVTRRGLLVPDMMCFCLLHYSVCSCKWYQPLSESYHHPSQWLSSKSRRHLSAWFSTGKLHGHPEGRLLCKSHYHPSKWFPRELSAFAGIWVTFQWVSLMFQQFISVSHQHASSQAHPGTLFCHPVSPGPPSPMSSGSQPRIGSSSQLVASWVFRLYPRVATAPSICYFSSL